MFNMVLSFSFFTDLGNEELESFQCFANILCYTQTHRMNNRKAYRRINRSVETGQVGALINMDKMCNLEITQGTGIFIIRFGTCTGSQAAFLLL